MNILFTVIAVLSIAAGVAWGYFHQMSVIGYIISLAVSGFIGSSIITLIFCYLYFYQTEPTPDQEGNRPKHTLPAITHEDPKEMKQIKK